MNYKELVLQAKDKYQIPVYEWKAEKQHIRGVVQLVHGSCEYATRYNDFAKFLVARGFIVYANDHRGHGKGVKDQEKLGFFAPKDGWKYIVDDIYEVTKYIKQEYPSHKIILLGHSMGSFVARHYAILYGKNIDGLILTGTTHYSKVTLKIGSCIAQKDINLGKAYNRNKLLDIASYSSFHYQFRKEKDSLAWLTRDKKVRDAMRNDEYFGFKFTSSAFKDMFDGLKFITDESEICKMPKNLPVYILSGNSDPVGGNGKMVKKTYELFRNSGMKSIKLKLYEDMRHEILNEVGKEEVYKDILNWINKIV